MIGIIAVYGTIFAGIALLIARDRILARRDAIRPLINLPESRKHCRVTVWSDGVAVAYYNHGGRKVTARRYSFGQYAAVIASAKARGYYVL